MPCSGWPQKPPDDEPPNPDLRRGLWSPCNKKEHAMLDLLIVVVTIACFIALIGFTRACEKL